MREFKNPYPDYLGENLILENGKIPDHYREKLYKNIQDLLGQLEREKPESDDSVYTGESGIAVLYLQLHKSLGNEQTTYLQKALKHLQHPLASVKGRKPSFLCGDAGPLALGAIVYHKLNQPAKSKECLQKLVSLHAMVIKSSSLPDEMLFGRAGYLYALLLIEQELGNDLLNPELIAKVVEKIIKSGQEMAESDGWSHPLMYMWHDSHYLGAAHGLAGILYMLLKACNNEELLMTHVKPCVDYMLTLRFPSGNCPSSLGSSSGDKLIHWCHGATGWIHMFLEAFQIFKEDKYLEAARSCADVVWQRGLLKKGYGICHGTAGNAYTFIAMYKTTREEKYLYRALKFADWCFDYGKHDCRIADRPFSLFEGMAGTIYFLSDLLDPLNAKFPAYEL